MNEYCAIMSHDIDFVSKYKSFRNVLGAIKRGNSISKSFIQYLHSSKDRTSDPYWTMDEMCDLDLNYNVKSYFYFMSGRSNSKFDLNDYSIFDSDIKELIIRLKSKGATIGLHPSYETYLDLELLRSEKLALEKVLMEPVVFSRQHFLRLKDPETFRILEEIGILEDSSVGPKFSVQLTTETNNAYQIEDSEKNIFLKLKEQPFLLMDTHLLSKPKEMISSLKSSVSHLKNVGGTCMIIWHNNNFETSFQRDLYEEVLTLIS